MCEWCDNFLQNVQLDILRKVILLKSSRISGYRDSIFCNYNRTFDKLNYRSSYG